MIKALPDYFSWRIKIFVRQIKKQLKDPFVSFLTIASVITLLLYTNNLFLLILSIFIFTLSKHKLILTFTTLLSIIFFTNWQVNYDRSIETTLKDESTIFQFTIVKDSVKRNFYNESVGYSQSHPYKFLIHTAPTNFLRRGDIVQTECEIQKPSNYDGYDFDYVNFLVSQNIYFICKVRDFDNVGKSLEHLPASVGREIKNIFEYNLVEPYSSIASGIFLGDRTEIPIKVRDALVRTGTLHITAVSGLHFSIFFGLAFAGLFFINIQKRLLIAIVLSFFYLSIIGFENISASRAFLMLTLVSLGVLYGKTISPLKALLIAASFSILTYTPIINNISFLLSYTATVSILIFYSRIFNLVSSNFKRANRKLVAFISIFLSVSIVVIPLSIITFGGYSLVSILGNLLITFSLPLLMLLIVVSILFNYAYPLGEMLFLILEVLMKILISTLEWLGSQDWAYTQDAAPVFFLVIMFYTPIILLDVQFFYKKYLK